MLAEVNTERVSERAYRAARATSASMPSVRSSLRSTGRSTRPHRDATHDAGWSPTHGRALVVHSCVISPSERWVLARRDSPHATRWIRPSSTLVGARPRAVSNWATLRAMRLSIAWVRRENSPTRSTGTPWTSRFSSRPATVAISFQATPNRSDIRSSTRPTRRSDRATIHLCMLRLSSVRQRPSETVWARSSTTT